MFDTEWNIMNSSNLCFAPSTSQSDSVMLRRFRLGGSSKGTERQRPRWQKMPAKRKLSRDVLWLVSLVVLSSATAWLLGNLVSCFLLHSGTPYECVCDCVCVWKEVPHSWDCFMMFPFTHRPHWAFPTRRWWLCHGKGASRRKGFFFVQLKQDSLYR